MSTHSSSPESGSLSALVAELRTLTARMARQNELLAQIVAHNADLLDAMSEEQEDEEQTTYLDGTPL